MRLCCRRILCDRIRQFFYLLLLFCCRGINATIRAIGVNFGIIRGVICCTLVIQSQFYHFVQSEGLRILVMLPESDYQYQ